MVLFDYKPVTVDFISVFKRKAKLSFKSASFPGLIEQAELPVYGVEMSSQ